MVGSLVLYDDGWRLVYPYNASWTKCNFFTWEKHAMEGVKIALPITLHNQLAIYYYEDEEPDN